VLRVANKQSESLLTLRCRFNLVSGNFERGNRAFTERRPRSCYRCEHANLCRLRQIGLNYCHGRDQSEEQSTSDETHNGTNLHKGASIPESPRVSRAISICSGGLRPRFCLALKALIQSQSATGRIRRGEPGASPQEIGLKLWVSAEGAAHGVHDPRFQR
jgi:hypothetical protein